MKKLIIAISVLFFICSATACGNKDESPLSNDIIASIEGDTSISTDIIKYDENDYYTEPIKNENLNHITLSGDKILINGAGATVSESTITINSAGNYIVSGTLNDGRIIVSATKESEVKLILDNANISCSNNSPIYIETADKVIISLAEGSTNTLTDGSTCIDENITATLFSKEDLTINGTGKLIVKANNNNGIQSKDDLKILSGDITVNSIDDGIVGKDMVQIKSGTVTIDAGGDGIKATNDAETDKGYVGIEGGTLKIIAGADGIQAVTSLVISGGNFNIITGGGSANASSTKGGNWGRWDNQKTSEIDTADSAKVLKSSNSILITGGTFNIDSSDDSIHSNNSVIINGGSFKLSSGDDGIHADTAVAITSGAIKISKSYEGIESESIAISGGEIDIVSSDDGINICGGNDMSAMGGRPGQNSFSSNASDNKLIISGGYLTVDAGGDGLDSNGSIYMSNGTVIVNGPTNDGNGALDYDGVFEITGGTLIASGSAGMAQSASSSPSQCTVKMTFASIKNAKTIFEIKDSSGNTVVNCIPAKNYRSVVISSPSLKTGNAYSIYSGDVKVIDFTLNNVVTNVSESGTSTSGGFNGGVRGEKQLPSDGSQRSKRQSKN